MPHRHIRHVIAHGLALLAVCLPLPATVLAADVTAPTVSITSPASAAVVFGGIAVTADASDDVGVVGVQFLLDSNPLGAEDTTAPFSLPWTTTSIGNGSHTLTARARDAAGHQTLSDPVTITVSNDTSPQQIGQWAPPVTLPIVAVHLTLLPTGEVLLWDGMENDADLVPRVWNPVTQALLDVPFASPVFCAHQTLLADGRVLVVGGHGPLGEDGALDTNIFDAATRTWTRVGDLRFPRWYATAVLLADGRVVAIDGQIDPGIWANTPELFSPLTNTWRLLRNVNTADVETGEYVAGHLLPDSRVGFLNPDTGRLRRLDVDAQTWENGGTFPMTYGTTAMYRPGRILVSGGSDGTATRGTDTRAMVIDWTGASPAWQATGSMTYGRFNHNLVVLADGSVLAVGGADRVDNETTLSNGILPAERWDPQTGAWSLLAAQQDPRMYHSTAVLLPDGRVLSAGGGRAGANVDYFTTEIFSPPYLFRGPRPVITSAPGTAAYGAAVAVQTPDAAAVASVGLVPLGSVTHTINSNQRYLDLAFTAGAGSITATMPASPAAATPGVYMLFLLNGQGVPSVASMLKLGNPSPAPAPLEAYQETGGQVVMEAEHYDQQTARAGKTWTIGTALAGASRQIYVEALPNTGTNINTSYTTTSPELVFNVTFATTGTYYVWVRGQGNTGNDDSCHAGLDGAGPASADRMSGFQSTSWVWKRDTMDGVPATVSITTPGLHTIHLWMREDGFKMDKLLLRKSSSSTPPSGTGPVESARVVLGGGDTTDPLISAVAASNVTASGATLTWTTDEPATSQVEYGTTTGYGTSTPVDATLVTAHSVTLSGLSPATPYHFVVHSSDGSGNAAVSADATFTTAAAGPASFQESAGQVVIEAEHYDAKVDRSSHSWQLQTSQSGFGGTGYEAALPNTGLNLNSGYVTTSPELVFNVTFSTTGTYYLWTRGAAPSGTDDSIHFGVDGTGPASADRVHNFPTGWSWKRDTMDGVPPTLVITSPGLHTIHLWMREDGVKVDRFLLRTSSSSTAPSGVGPAESPRAP